MVLSNASLKTIRSSPFSQYFERVYLRPIVLELPRTTSRGILFCGKAFSFFNRFNFCNVKIIIYIGSGLISCFLKHFLTSSTMSSLLMQNYLQYLISLTSTGSVVMSPFKFLIMVIFFFILLDLHFYDSHIFLFHVFVLNFIDFCSYLYFVLPSIFIRFNLLFF